MKYLSYIFLISVFSVSGLFAYNPLTLKQPEKNKTTHVDRGEELFLHGKYAELAEYLEELSKQGGGELKPVDLILKCRYLILTGKYAEAQQTLQSLIKKEPENWQTRMLLFDIFEITGNRRGMRLQERFFRNCYRSGKLKTAAAYTAAGKALSIRSPKLALVLFGKAIVADEKYEKAYLEAGILCFDYYAWGQANKNFSVALKINSDSLEALAGLAVLKFSNGDIKGTSEIIKRIFDVNPMYLDALELKIGVLIAQDKLDDACKGIDNILKVNPNRISVLGLRAAYLDMKGDFKKRDALISEIHKISLDNVQVYLFLAQMALRQYRIPDAVQWSQKALSVDPENWSGYYECGIALLRLGEEREGFEMLDKSFKLNSFNIPAYNILTVLDRDFKGGELVLRESEHFAVKMPKADADIIWPYLEGIMERAYKKFTERYKIIPKGPKEYNGKILVLILDDPQSFSVRTIGLTGLGAVGVCFGQVLMMPSPRYACLGYGRGLSWKSIFEHEFLHILTLQKSNYKVSRWFTEGISTSEESDAHGNWRRLFAAAGKSGKLLPLEKLESGFILPTYSGQVPVSYYQAALTCRFFEEKYGFESLLKILDQYSKGKKTAQVIPEVCGVSLKDMNKQLERYYQDNWELAGECILDMKNSLEKEKDAVKEERDRVKTEAITGARHWEPMVDIWLKKDEQGKAIKFLESLVAFDDGDYLPSKRLGNIYFDNKAYKKATEMLLQVCYRNPYDIETHRKLAECYNKLGEAKLASREKAIVQVLVRGKSDPPLP